MIICYCLFFTLDRVLRIELYGGCCLYLCWFLGRHPFDHGRRYCIEIEVSLAIVLYYSILSLIFFVEYLQALYNHT